jgi:hypothetical protein
MDEKFTNEIEILGNKKNKKKKKKYKGNPQN